MMKEKMTKKEMLKIWKLLDYGCEAIERLSETEEGRLLLEDHENRIDFSSIVILKNEVEQKIEARTRKGGQS